MRAPSENEPAAGCATLSGETFVGVGRAKWMLINRRWLDVADPRLPGREEAVPRLRAALPDRARPHRP
jgi:hypothetical protein